MFTEAAFDNVSMQCPICPDNTMVFWIVGIVGFWLGCMLMVLLLRKPRVVYIEREEDEDDGPILEIFKEDEE